jgi:hypothetical protein
MVSLSNHEGVPQGREFTLSTHCMFKKGIPAFAGVTSK